VTVSLKSLGAVASKPDKKGGRGASEGNLTKSQDGQKGLSHPLAVIRRETKKKVGGGEIDEGGQVYRVSWGQNLFLQKGGGTMVNEIGTSGILQKKVLTMKNGSRSTPKTNATSRDGYAISG